MSDAPATPPSRGPLLAAGLLAGLGFVLFAIGMIAAIRADVAPRQAVVLGLPAWQFAAAGFVCTLAGGLWLRRLVK